MSNDVAKNTIQQHTPGPWIANGSLVEANGVVLAHVFDEPGFFANVRLIAKAPDMYAALRQFIERVESGDIRSSLTYELAKSALEGIDQ